ncbi:sensor domain-containing diguanylate cyclase [Hydrogenophaga atypica]|uniref:diguanylate cyclase n=1 Tax=Hydrogenophaga atypica TaxID=249409 RepID=A0ABW2QET4_9BURK
MNAMELGGAHPLRLPSVRWLLLLVVLMAVASATALWLTLQQARELGRPNQHADLWYVASVNSELARVRQVSHQLLAGEASAQELLLRLEVLYSVLDKTSALTSLSDRLHHQLPHTAATMRELSHHVDAWLHTLTPRPSASGERVARDVLSWADGLQQQTRMAVADVHVAVTEENDATRQSLHQRFVLLSALLAGLLLGTAALIRHLAQEARRARHLSRTLAQANQMLESRVAERTRQIEEGRQLLSFILDASPSDVLLIGADNSEVIFINQSLIRRLNLAAPPKHLPKSELLQDPAQCQQLSDELERYGEVGGLEALLGHNPPTWCSVSARLIEVDGRLSHLIWSFDITPHKRLEAQLRELAASDPLCGLDNRRAFLEKSTALLEHCRRHQQDCAVLMLDIDRFKSINDRYGHAVGDQAIIACANAMRATLRDADVLGRLGGEEFAALLPLAGERATRDTAERLRGAVEAIRIELENGDTLSFTISIGTTQLANRATLVEDLMIEADEALYRAKAEGRNRVVNLQPLGPRQFPEALAPPA